MRLAWREGAVYLRPGSSSLDDGLIRFWARFQPSAWRPGEGELRLVLMSRANLAVWALIVGWAVFYFTYQFRSLQEPRYLGEGLFSDAPSYWLQDHRHIVLDYFFAYSWVLLFIAIALLFLTAAVATRERFYCYGLVFLVSWMVQGLIQLSFNVAPPVRDPATELVFIRAEVFPLSEYLVGVKYGAFPSGHIGVTLLTILLARRRGLIWLERLALGCLAVLALGVIYLGEHYLADIAASLLLYPGVFYLITFGFDRAEAKKM